MEDTRYALYYEGHIHQNGAEEDPIFIREIKTLKEFHIPKNCFIVEEEKHGETGWISISEPIFSKENHEGFKKGDYCFVWYPDFSKSKSPIELWYCEIMDYPKTGDKCAVQLFRGEGFKYPGHIKRDACKADLQHIYS